MEDEVKKALVNENYRDNDNALYLYILLQIDPALRDQTTTFWYFASNMKNGKYPPMESVTRARRKVQEKFPFLRGSTYQVRQELEKEVREGINQ